MVKHAIQEQPAENSPILYENQKQTVNVEKEYRSSSA